MHIVEQVHKFLTKVGVSIEDPAIDQFILYIDFADDHGLFADESYPNSALAYLKRTGETIRYENLKIAIKTLQDLTTDAHSRIISVDNIGSILQNRQKIGAVNDLQVKFYETIDWPMRHCMLSILQAYYDDVRQIEVLPMNLRRFSAMLYFKDARALINLSEGNGETGEINASNSYSARYGEDITNLKTPLTGNEEVHSIDITQQQHFCLHMPACYIDFTALPFGSNNTDTNPSEHSLQLTFRTFLLSGYFPALSAPPLSTKLTNSSQTEKVEYQNLLQTTLLAHAAFLRQQANRLKSVAMARVLEETGITEALANVKKIFSPELLFGGTNLNKLFNEAYKQYVRKPIDKYSQPVKSYTDYINKPFS